MRLKEKFGNVVLNQNHNSSCEKIADEFAIGFSEWLNKNNYFDAVILDSSITTKLLKMYKEENGL